MMRERSIWCVIAKGVGVRLLVATLIATALLTLAGCDGVQSTPPPAVVVKTITVDRPVAVPCVNASDIPAMPPRVGDQMTGDSAHDLDVVSASALRLRKALGLALSLLGACVK